MGLVAQSLQYLQRIVAVIETDGFAGKERKHLFFALGEGYEVDSLHTHSVEDLLDRRELSLSPVDHDEVGAGKAFFLLRSQLAKAALQHFLQTGEVVGALHRPDLKAAVAVPLGFAVRKHDHGSHLVHAADMGDIVTFHAAGIAGKPERLLQSAAGKHRAVLLVADLIHRLFQIVGGVFLRHLRKLLPYAHFRAKDIDYFSRLFLKILFEQ